MHEPPVQEPLYVLAARCLGELTELLNRRTDDQEGIAAAATEDPGAPFSRIVGFLPELGEADSRAPPLRDREVARASPGRR
jgi:hypothetical protein